LQSSLEQIDNQLYIWINSASYPQWDGTGNEQWLTVYGMKAYVADWSSGMSTGCTAGPVVFWRGKWMAA